MDIAAVTSLIAEVGFPIVAVMAMAWFVYQVFQKMAKQSAENMKQIQDNCQVREDRLYQEIKENREVNAQAVATIALYADKLGTIQTDVAEIKTDVAILMNKN